MRQFGISVHSACMKAHIPCTHIRISCLRDTQVYLGDVDGTMGYLHLECAFRRHEQKSWIVVPQSLRAATPQYTYKVERRF